jgi:hypothetical protein
MAQQAKDPDVKLTEIAKALGFIVKILEDNESPRVKRLTARLWNAVLRGRYLMFPSRALGSAIPKDHPSQSGHQG